MTGWGADGRTGGQEFAAVAGMRRVEGWLRQGLWTVLIAALLTGAPVVRSSPGFGLASLGEVTQQCDDGPGQTTPCASAHGLTAYEGDGTLSNGLLYDAACNLVRMYVNQLYAATANPLPGTNTYRYDGDEPVEELTGTGPTVTAVNTFGAQGLVSWRAGSTPGTTAVTGAGTDTNRLYQFDPSGNVAHRTDGSGALQSSDLYDVWGNRQGSWTGTGGAATTPDPWGFGGQYGYYTDALSNLMLLGQRYYDPTRGRFLKRDPIGYAGGPNLYEYVGDGPVNEADPSGFDTLLDSEFSDPETAFELKDLLRPDQVDPMDPERPPIIRLPARPSPGPSMIRRCILAVGGFVGGVFGHIIIHRHHDGGGGGGGGAVGDLDADRPWSMVSRSQVSPLSGRRPRSGRISIFRGIMASIHQLRATVCISLRPCTTWEQPMLW